MSAEKLAAALLSVSDYEVDSSLSDYEESALCEDLAPIIEQYGLATVENALTAIRQSGAWGRGTPGRNA